MNVSYVSSSKRNLCKDILLTLFAVKWIHRYWESKVFVLLNIVNHQSEISHILYACILHIDNDLQF